MRRIRIYNQTRRLTQPTKEEPMLIPTLSALGGGLIFLLGALWWVLRD